MELIQIGQQPAIAPTVTIMEMFQQLAQREAEFTRNARERVLAERSTRASRLG